MRRFVELPLAGQTAYAELAEQARTLELSNALAGLQGPFQRMRRKGASYWYFAYRDLDRRVRMAYQAAIALGCAATAPKHFRVIKRLSGTASSAPEGC